KSEHAAAVEAVRDEWVAVGELAGFLAGQRDYPDADFVEDEEGLLELKDDVWDQAVAEEERGLRQLAAQGELPSRGRGKNLKLQNRALQRFGHDVGAVPEDYLSYRILPDSQAQAVEAERAALRGLQRVVDWQQSEGPSSQV